VRGFALIFVATLLPAQTPALRSVAPGVRYTGSKICAGCHKRIYDRYLRTPMGRSITRPAAGVWGAPAVLRSETLHRDFRVYSENGVLYQAESEASVFETSHRLEYAIGSGENGVSFVVRRGNYLFQAPLSYYSKASRWDLSPGFEQVDEGFSRPIAEGCLACHAGRPRPKPGIDGMYEDPPFAEMAIGCETCHGPGQLHVEERGRGIGPKVDTSIVNPARLPARLAEDICIKCHQAGDARVLLPGKNYADIRPGVPLVGTLAIFGLRSEAGNEDLLEHHSSMKMSRCYRASNGKLSCLTCHDPHEQPAPATVPAYFRAKCLGCHTEESCKVARESRRRSSPPDNCAGCHMPKREVARISHSALTNHRIPARPGQLARAVPPEPEGAALPALVLLNQQPGEPPLPLVTRLAVYGELLNRAPQLRATYLALLEEAKHALPDDGLVLAALGRKALVDGNPEAAALLLRAEQQGLHSAATYLDLGQALMKADRLPDAIAALERGVHTFPFSKPLRKHLILADIRARQYPKAKSALEQYVNDFPEDSFMRGLLVQVGR
jgi:predicted CXXCH cytochrome family protein